MAGARPVAASGAVGGGGGGGEEESQGLGVEERPQLTFAERMRGFFTPIIPMPRTVQDSTFYNEQTDHGDPARKSSWLALSLMSLVGVKGTTYGKEQKATDLSDYAEALRAQDAADTPRSNFWTDCFGDGGSFASKAAIERREARAEKAGQDAYNKACKKGKSRDEANQARRAAEAWYANTGWRARLVHYFHPKEVWRDWGRYIADFASRDLKGGVVRTGQAMKLEYLKVRHLWNSTRGVYGVPTRLIFAAVGVGVGFATVALTAAVNILRAALIGLPIMLLNMAGRNILYFGALTAGLFFFIKWIVPIAAAGGSGKAFSWAAWWATYKVYVYGSLIGLGGIAYGLKEIWTIATIRRQGRAIAELRKAAGQGEKSDSYSRSTRLPPSQAAARGRVGAVGDDSDYEGGGGGRAAGDSGAGAAGQNFDFDTTYDELFPYGGDDGAGVAPRAARAAAAGGGT